MQAKSVDHEVMAGKLRLYFMDELSPREGATLREHIRGCSSCRAEYERWASAEHALFEHRGELSPLMLNRIAQNVVPPLGTETARAQTHRPWLYALASAAALLLAVRIFTPIADESETFLPRGETPKVSSALSVRVVAARLSEDGSAPAVFDLGSGRTPLQPGDYLQIRLSHEHLGFVRVFLLQAGRTTPLMETEPLPPAGEDVALAARIQVDDRFAPGPGMLLISVAEERDRLAARAHVEASDEPGRLTRLVKIEVER